MYMIKFLWEITVIFLYISYITQIISLVSGLFFNQITTKRQIKYLAIPFGFILYIIDSYKDMEE